MQLKQRIAYNTTKPACASDCPTSEKWLLLVEVQDLEIGQSFLEFADISDMCVGKVEYLQILEFLEGRDISHSSATQVEIFETVQIRN